MSKLSLLMHVSLDGFVAGPKGEMDWIYINPEMFDYVGELTDESDTAVYGRVTYQMMESYWPGAGDLPGATDHDKKHAHWYNTVNKVILSRTMNINVPHVQVISDHLKEQMEALKRADHTNMLMIGSPSAAHALMAENLIDEFHLMINPILLGKGIPLFKDFGERKKLDLLSSRSFAAGGVMALHYARVK